MRRLRILMTGVLAFAVVGALGGVAHADRPAFGDFCDIAEEAQDALTGADFEDIDFSDPDAFQEVYENAADAMGEAGKQAPKKLKGAFKTARKYFEQLAEIDFTDPDELEDAFIPSAKVTRAFAKISDYLFDECDLDGTGEDLEE